MDPAAHWEHIYGKRPPTEQGWYTDVLRPSLEWILKAHPDRNARILDAGGGASTLVDHLIDEGCSGVQVLDISANALSLAQQRLGELASKATWIHGDVLTADTPLVPVDVWHDRAVFHFLHEEANRQAYRRRIMDHVAPEGILIMGTFRPDGPDKCSGLPVRRHSADELEAFFSPEFALEETLESMHVTPGGVEQAYVWVRMRRQRTGSDT